MMFNHFLVERLPSNFATLEYDLVLAVIGYEKRARYFAESNPLRSKRKVACGFTRQQVLEYSNNLNWFNNNEYVTASVDDEDYQHWLEDLLQSIEREDRALLLLVDISSLSRKRMANTLGVLRRFSDSADVVVHFVYCLAVFSSPAESQVPNTHVGPVTFEFSGWWTEPDRPLSVVVGLGYEEDKALGAVEHLQAEEVWLFEPESVESKYTVALQEANATLLASTDQAHHFRYRVHDPFDCFARLQSLIRGLSLRSNVVLLPFGPKIFGLCSLLVASADNQVAVWRVSAQADEQPVNRRASGHVYGLKVFHDHLKQL